MTVKAKQAPRAEAERVAAAASQDQQQAAAAAADAVVTDLPHAPGRVAAADPAAGERQAVDVTPVDAAARTPDAGAELAATIVPTPAPQDSGIGMLAQAPAPATTDTPPATSDTPAASPTDAPPTDAPPAATGMSPWLIGGLAVLGVGAVAAIASGGGDDSPPAAATPPATPPAATPPATTPPPAGTPPATPPAPPAATDPLAPTNFESATYSKPGGSAATGLYVADGNNNNTVDAGERVVFYNAANQHYYEVVISATTVTWDAANQGAITRGGHLVTFDTPAEAAFLQQAYGYAFTGDNVTRAPTYGANAPVYGGLPADELAGDLGAWVGLRADAAGAWSSITTAGAAGGPAFATTDPLWLAHYNDSNPNGDPTTGGLRGAMVGGNNLVTDGTPGTGRDPAATQILYDVQGTAPQISRYVVEYETLAQLNAGQVTAVTIDSVSGGGTLDPAAASPSFASTNLSSLIDDPSHQA